MLALPALWHKITLGATGWLVAVAHVLEGYFGLIDSRLRRYRPCLPVLSVSQLISTCSVDDEFVQS